MINYFFKNYTEFNILSLNEAFIKIKNKKNKNFPNKKYLFNFI